ncbi:MAG: thiosulfate oxidation carrier protein SoxY [Pseudomonadota bacterium]
MEVRMEVPMEVPMEKWMTVSKQAGFSRRRLLRAGLGAGVLVSTTSIRAWEANQLDLLNRFYDQPPRLDDAVRLKIPALAENGNSVRLQVEVVSAAEQLRGIEIYAPLNPEPLLARFQFSRFTASSNVHTRIRIAAEQDVIAVARFADGPSIAAAAHIVVTEAACLEALI